MNAIEKFYLRRNSRLRQRGLSAIRTDGNTRLPYGIAKGMGIDTTGMLPKEVWEALAGKGVSPKEEYKKLSERGKAKKKASAVNVAPKSTFEFLGKTYDHLRIGIEQSKWKEEPKDFGEFKWMTLVKTPTLMGVDENGNSSVIGGTKYEGNPYSTLYALKKAGVTNVEYFNDGKGNVHENINPQTFKFPHVISKMGAKIKATKMTVPTDAKSIVVEDWDGNKHKLHSDIRSNRDQLLHMTGIDILNSSDISEKTRKTLREADEIRNNSITVDGTEYKNLVVRNGSSIMTGSSDDSATHSVIYAGHDKGAFIALKRMGIKKVLVSNNGKDDEVVDIDSMELPETVGYLHEKVGNETQETYYTSLAVARSKDKYVINAVDLYGIKRPIYTGDSPNDCVNYAVNKLHAKSSDVKVAKARKESEKTLPTGNAEWKKIVDGGIEEFRKAIRGVKLGTSFSLEERSKVWGTEYKTRTVFVKGSDGWNYIEYVTKIGKEEPSEGFEHSISNDEMYKRIKRITGKVA